jgi:histidinol-phosphate aminotransferase
MSSEKMRVPTPQPGVLRINPYLQGDSEVQGTDNPIKLSSNESSLGPSPSAIDAYHNAATDLNRYPDGSQAKLRGAIARTFDLNAANIVCGNGSDELIQLLTRAFVAAGDEVLMSENCFVMCRIHALAQNATVVVAPEKDDCVDVDALLARVSEKTRLLTLANPNNPTGTYINADEVRRLHAGLPTDVILLLDGAYAEFVMADDYDAGADLVLANSNVVMTRTFSKAFGLAALRVGWAYMPEGMMDAVQRIRTPFNANGPAMVAATAAVADSAYLEMIRQHNSQAIQKITRRLRSYGLVVVPTVTNFYLIRFPEKLGVTAADADAQLRAAGIIPRPVGGDGDSELRISVGSDAENEAVLAVFESLMKPNVARKA